MLAKASLPQPQTKQVWSTQWQWTGHDTTGKTKIERSRQSFWVSLLIPSASKPQRFKSCKSILVAGLENQWPLELEFIYCMSLTWFNLQCLCKQAECHAPFGRSWNWSNSLKTILHSISPLQHSSKPVDPIAVAEYCQSITELIVRCWEAAVG